MSAEEPIPFVTWTLLSFSRCSPVESCCQPISTSWPGPISPSRSCSRSSSFRLGGKSTKPCVNDAQIKVHRIQYMQYICLIQYCNVLMCSCWDTGICAPTLRLSERLLAAALYSWHK